MSTSEQFDTLIGQSFTNGEVDQMEQDATDAYVAYEVERIESRVKAAGVARQVMSRRRFRFGESR